VVDADWLEARLYHQDLVIVDVRLPFHYGQDHIPGAVNIPSFFLSVPQNGAPAREGLVRLLGKHGISRASHVVAYDNGPEPGAAMLFFLLTYYGHPKISVLDGGFSVWNTLPKPSERGIPPLRPTAYCAGEVQSSSLVSTEDVLKTLNSENTLVLDVRSPAEYQGSQFTAARNGHIPGSINIEWSAVFQEDTDADSCLKPEKELQQLFDGAGVSRDKRVIVHCQSGSRASHTFMVLHGMGYTDVAHYTGGWQEWGNRADTPVEEG